MSVRQFLGKYRGIVTKTGKAWTWQTARKATGAGK